VKKLSKITKTAHLLAALCLLVGTLPLAALTGITPVYADGREQPAESAPSPDGESNSASPDTPQTISSVDTDEVDQPGMSEIEENQASTESFSGEHNDPEMVSADSDLEPSDDGLSEAQPSEKELDDAQEPNATEASIPVSSAPSEDLADVVDLLNHKEIILTDSNGEPLALASQAAAQVLSGSDPFFWDGAQWVGYTTTGIGCPENVVCQQSDTPFQTAVSAAPAGTTIYVAQGHYDEDVTISQSNVSFVGFSTIDVPLAFEALTPVSAGYATVRSITLNADFGTTSGVYANTVFVNAGGKLNDGLSLVNIGGTVEANVILKSGDGHYRIHDANDNNTYFEWECAEPNVLIYPDRNYRMVFKDPFHGDILKYFEDQGDERKDLLVNPLNLSANERLNHLILGANLANQSLPTPWTHAFEERIFWYLLGNIGKDVHNNNITLTSAQQKLADDIVAGLYDEIQKPFGIWFLWPMLENGNPVSPENRQLTVIVYDIPEVTGCTDPGMFNYDPNANVSGGCVSACQWDASMPSNSPNCHAPSTPGGGGGTSGGGVVPSGVVAAIIPVTAPTGTGSGAELMLIPVTGLDLAYDAGSLQATLLNLGMLLFGSALALEGISRRAH